MRIVVTMILAVLLGVALGAGIAIVRLRQNAWDAGRLAAVVRATKPETLPASAAGEVSAAGSPGAAHADGTARAVVDHEEYDFGRMGPDEERNHAFVFTNQGTAPLKLTAGATSCRCTLATLDAGEIPPGKSGKVVLSWKAKGVIGEYRQNAQILTNDPKLPMVSLRIAGEIVALLQSEPANLVFSRMSSTERAQAEVRIWCTAAAPALEVVSFDLSDPKLAKYFRVQHRPLTTAEIAEKKGIKSGVLVQVAVLPGLPQGAFQQTIELHTNLKGEPTISLPVQGTIGSDVSVAGSGWDSDLGLLNLGTVASQSGAQRRLILIVRGPHAKETRFKAVQADPEFLEVELGRSAPIGAGTAWQTPLIVRIPKGSRRTSRLGTEQGKLGEILLETTNPQVPRVRILIRFAVEG